MTRSVTRLRPATRSCSGLLGLVLAAQVGCAAASVGPQPIGLPGRQQPQSQPHGRARAVERVVVAMGTTLHLEVHAADRAAALGASEAAVRAVEAVEQRLSTWRPDSELSRFQTAPVGAPFAASRALCDDLRRARRWFERTGGAFDPAVGALITAYDLRGAGRWPDEREVTAALGRCGMQHVTIGDRSLRRARPVRLDAGAFGKGVALDGAAAAAVGAGADAVALDFGGQLRLAGGAGPRALDIADPRDRARPALRLRIDGGSVATTANSERGRRVDGRRLSHVLDPRTGAPARDFGAVTVWAERALDADALSTACFVLGPERALALAEETPGVEVVVLRWRGPAGPLEARVSSGLRGRVTPLISDLQLP